MKCIMCGKEFNENNIKEAEVCSIACAHTLEFWLEITADTDKKIIIVDNRCYRLRAEDETNAGFRGFSGARFYIRLNDGTEITTTNLWHMGTVPEAFQKELPNNATFIKPEADKRYTVIYKNNGLQK